MAEELVVEQGPDQGAHLARVALDHLGLVHAVDQDDDPGVAERGEHALELAEQLVTLLAAGPGRRGQGLAAELARAEPEQFPAQGGGVAAEDADGLADVARVPLGPRQPPGPVEPAQERPARAARRRP